MTSFSARGVSWKLILTNKVRRKIHHVKPQLYTHANFLFSLTDYVAFVQAAVSALLFKNLKEKLLFLSYLTLIIKCCSIPWQSKSFMQHFIAACRVSQEDLEGKSTIFCQFSKQKLLNFCSRRLFMENTFSFCVRKKNPSGRFLFKIFSYLGEFITALESAFCWKIILFIYFCFLCWLPAWYEPQMTTKVSHTHNFTCVISFCKK